MMWNGSGWYGFIGAKSKSETDISLPKTLTSINVKMAYFTQVNSAEKHVGAAFHICMLCLI